MGWAISSVTNEPFLLQRTVSMQLTRTRANGLPKLQSRSMGSFNNAESTSPCSRKLEQAEIWFKQTPFSLEVVGIMKSRKRLSPLYSSSQKGEFARIIFRFVRLSSLMVKHNFINIRITKRTLFQLSIPWHCCSRQRLPRRGMPRGAASGWRPSSPLRRPPSTHMRGSLQPEVDVSPFALIIELSWKAYPNAPHGPINLFHYQWGFFLT